jgi:hypothetical protein
MKSQWFLLMLIFILSGCNRQSQSQKWTVSEQLISDSAYVAPSKDEELTVKPNYVKEQNEIWVESQGSERLLGVIPYNDYEDWFVKTPDAIYFTRKIDTKKNPREIKKEIMLFSLREGKITSSGIHTAENFAVSRDGSYICVAMDDYWEDDSWSAMHFSIPYLYQLSDKRLIKKYDFSNDFLANEYGISLDIEYEELKNFMVIKYHWDAPVSEFEGIISLADFKFLRTK